jgi:hypothetical protein
MLNENSVIDTDCAVAQPTPDPVDWKTQIGQRIHDTAEQDSHVERDAITFHPSQLAKCKRQATLAKFGLKEFEIDTLGTFRAGTIIHEWLQSEMAAQFPGCEFEREIEQTYRNPDSGEEIRVTGHADLWDPKQGIVYDFKTRGGWYNFNPPTDRHLDQLTLYMDALNAEAGQIVYINRKNLEIRPWPAETTYPHDVGRRTKLVQKARKIRDGIREADEITSKADVPFKDCGCWLCGQE